MQHCCLQKHLRKRRHMVMISRIKNETGISLPVFKLQHSWVTSHFKIDWKEVLILFSIVSIVDLWSTPFSAPSFFMNVNWLLWDQTKQMYLNNFDTISLMQLQRMIELATCMHLVSFNNFCYSFGRCQQWSTMI